MRKKNTTANLDITQIILDCSVLLFAYFCAYLLYAQFKNVALSHAYVWLYMLFTVIFVLCMSTLRMYNITTFYYYDRIIRCTIMSTALAGMTVTIAIFLSHITTASRLFFLIFCFLGCSGVLFVRFFVRWTKRNSIGNGYTHIFFVGDEDALHKYTAFLVNTAMRVKIDRHMSLDDPAISSPDKFEELLKDLSADEVVFVYSGTELVHNVKSLLEICEDMGVTARLVLDMFDLPNSGRFISSIGTYPVLTYHSVSFNKAALFVKSVIDFVGAIFGLVVFSPIFLFTAVAIKLESPGPVIFAQTRIGKYGRPFKMYKFRSMYQDAEERKKDLVDQNKVEGGYMFKVDNDPRVTKVGRFIRKTSIDELPQLLNVLRQNMSLVGTRPPTPDEVVKYSRDHWRRISIKPGITGMWQTCGRSDVLDFNEVVRLDKEYIDDWSLRLDMKIILRTVSAVVSRRGAS